MENPAKAPAPTSWRLLANHLGYEPGSAKKAVVDTAGPAAPDSFRLTRIFEPAGIYAPGSPAPREAAAPSFEGPVAAVGPVDGWKGFHFHRLDFTPLDEAGSYALEVRDSRDGSWTRLGRVEIGPGIQERRTLPYVLGSFKSLRSSGRFDRADRAAPFFGGRESRVDVHGGWYDASGDTSKYLSHLSYANFFNPQQSPMAVWAFLEAADRIEASLSPGGAALAAGADGDAGGGEDRDSRERRLGCLSQRLLDEAAYGADFLARMQDPAGYFYETVFDQWSKDPGERMICSYSTRRGARSERCQAGWRRGGGMAIAALARMSGRESCGGLGREAYRSAAIRGFEHLESRGREYLPDGQENILDDYCALLAATELFAACGEPRFAESAGRRAASLRGRLSEGHGFSGWWRSGEGGGRPFYHAADAGLPVVALVRAVEGGALAAADRERAIAAVRASLEFELGITAGVPNPFGYARQLVTPRGGPPRAAFFMPHRNETGYWWQGENARLASLAAACRMASGLFPGDPEFRDRLSRFSADQLDWIMGLNPFDSCMIYGLGRNNAEYVDYLPNVPGGICNGATSGFRDESDIAFAPPGQRDDPGENWRWGEQWICHASWFILAMALQIRAATTSRAPRPEEGIP